LRDFGRPTRHGNGENGTKDDCRLGVDPADAAAVEDSTNGLRAAAAAGMVLIASPNRKYPPEPDALALAALVVESLDELTPDAIESAAQRARKQRTSG
jgi:beta-phosphoglucomutase-like phosphatase (HAD superfamily)